MDTPAKEQKAITPTVPEIESWGRRAEQELTVEAPPTDASELAPARRMPDTDLPAGDALTTAPVSVPAKSQLEKEIEDVLAEDLEGLYWELSEPERMIFKHGGEETASKIRLLLGETVVRVQEIFNLIVEWLKLLPGVSKFFIEQEAKIKTDKLLKFR
ncbi:hypothetical protein A3I40_03220 [Candidatus Uhrbacteria bacterium RIFCSPLOWO2_02_FULL_48_12]|uniref:Uncharacterized protein n=1 Tax=Candidatus Uhrbacteria bacterium RIFCSPLOWO2_02_FULL_48_12 TaxID=1802407 RepID=A0A1F7V6J0_9BACT|nr:MAG: hypothetical protein A3I40_03220 [Candidatus Uhrbacteria bacterium RIFCSPLOWO2_02_FULL_48_12]